MIFFACGCADLQDDEDDVFVPGLLLKKQRPDS